MAYLSITNFWNYQNADAWKKAKSGPPKWCKLYSHHDREMLQQPEHIRLLWFELLRAATRHSNVLEADLKWICSEVRMEPKRVAEGLKVLRKGGWLTETQTPRRSRKVSRQPSRGSSRPNARGKSKKKEKNLPQEGSFSSTGTEETPPPDAAAENGAAPPTTTSLSKELIDGALRWTRSEGHQLPRRRYINRLFEEWHVDEPAYHELVAVYDQCQASDA
jgi:hypothetical protein